MDEVDELVMTLNGQEDWLNAHVSRKHDSESFSRSKLGQETKQLSTTRKRVHVDEKENRRVFEGWRLTKKFSEPLLRHPVQIRALVKWMDLATVDPELPRTHRPIYIHGLALVDAWRFYRIFQFWKSFTRKCKQLKRDGFHALVMFRRERNQRMHVLRACDSYYERFQKHKALYKLFSFRVEHRRIKSYFHKKVTTFQKRLVFRRLEKQVGYKRLLRAVDDFSNALLKRSVLVAFRENCMMERRNHRIMGLMSFMRQRRLFRAWYDFSINQRQKKMGTKVARYWYLFRIFRRWARTVRAIHQERKVAMDHVLLKNSLLEMKKWFKERQRMHEIAVKFHRNTFFRRWKSYCEMINLSRWTRVRRCIMRRSFTSWKTYYQRQRRSLLLDIFDTQKSYFGRWCAHTVEEKARKQMIASYLLKKDRVAQRNCLETLHWYAQRSKRIHFARHVIINTRKQNWLRKWHNSLRIHRLGAIITTERELKMKQSFLQVWLQRTTERVQNTERIVANAREVFLSRRLFHQYEVLRLCFHTWTLYVKSNELWRTMQLRRALRSLERYKNRREVVHEYNQRTVQLLERKQVFAIRTCIHKLKLNARSQARKRSCNSLSAQFCRRKALERGIDSLFYFRSIQCKQDRAKMRIGIVRKMHVLRVLFARVRHAKQVRMGAQLDRTTLLRQSLSMMHAFAQQAERNRMGIALANKQAKKRALRRLLRHTWHCRAKGGCQRFMRRYLLERGFMAFCLWRDDRIKWKVAVKRHRQRELMKGLEKLRIMVQRNRVRGEAKEFRLQRAFLRFVQQLNPRRKLEKENTKRKLFEHSLMVRIRGKRAVLRKLESYVVYSRSMRRLRGKILKRAVLSCWRNVMESELYFKALRLERLRNWWCLWKNDSRFVVKLERVQKRARFAQWKIYRMVVMQEKMARTHHNRTVQRNIWDAWLGHLYLQKMRRQLQSLRVHFQGWRGVCLQARKIREKLFAVLVSKCHGKASSWLEDLGPSKEDHPFVVRRLARTIHGRKVFQHLRRNREERRRQRHFEIMGSAKLLRHGFTALQRFVDQVKAAKRISRNRKMKMFSKWKLATFASMLQRAIVRFWFNKWWEINREQQIVDNFSTRMSLISLDNHFSRWHENVEQAKHQRDALKTTIALSKKRKAWAKWQRRLVLARFVRTFNLRKYFQQMVFHVERNAMQRTLFKEWHHAITRTKQATETITTTITAKRRRSVISCVFHIWKRSMLLAHLIHRAILKTHFEKLQANTTSSKLLEQVFKSWTTYHSKVKFQRLVLIAQSEQTIIKRRVFNRLCANWRANCHGMK